MDCVRLGRTGLKVSRLCLGAMTYGTPEWRPWILDEAASRAAQIALAWLLPKPGVTAPIIGASKLPQLDDAVGALAIRLDAAELAFLEEPYQPHAILGHV